MIRFANAFVKITGWPVQLACLRTKIHYEDRSVQRRCIKGPAIIISNHTSVFDYAVWLFVFFSRTLRFQMAEVLFRKKGLGLLLKALGGIYVDRGARDMGFVARSEEILKCGGIVGIFPEGRLPRPGESRPLPFAASAAYLAIRSGVPVIPVYTDGSYFSKKRAHVIIGVPFRASSIVSGEDKSSIKLVSDTLRARIIELGNELDEQKTSSVRV